VACPTGARIFGDLKDPKSRISRLLKRHRHRYLKPDLGTTPKVAYFGLDSEII
jgi:tetrathionate reductase subunit B